MDRVGDIKRWLVSSCLLYCYICVCVVTFFIIAFSNVAQPPIIIIVIWFVECCQQRFWEYNRFIRCRRDETKAFANKWWQSAHYLENAWAKILRGIQNDTLWIWTNSTRVLSTRHTTHVPYIRREFIKLCNDAGRMHDDPSHTSLHHLPNKSHESYSIWCAPTTENNMSFALTNRHLARKHKI